ERSFVKHRGSRERGFVLRQQFLVARNKFDKLLRSTERSYKRGLMIDIENECMDNPREFWSHLKNLGPKRKQSVPCEVYDSDGNICTDPNFVDNIWTRDFSNLYNTQNDEFDQEFYDNMLQHKRLLEDNMRDPLYTENRCLNSPLSRLEVEKVVFRAKNGKSVGFDKIPYEVLKFPIIIDSLHSLFSLCLDSGLIPSVWRKAVITPIPKDTTKDLRIPLNYRGISLLCAVSKLYSSVLNNRLLPYLEANGLLVEEQNGFRTDRSCQDHVYSACSIIRDRLSQKKSTFATFIDLQKAFDWLIGKLYFTNCSSIK
ncbi:MAG: reverse transcriptase domain-containing protein, partial [Candidatus Thiodiazotropha sp.]